MSQTNRHRAICTFCTASAASIFLFFGSGCGDGANDDEAGTGQSAAGAALFMKEVRPLLEKKCVPCHNSQTISGKLNLESRKTAFGGSDNGAFLVPGDPEASLIYRVTAKPHGDEAVGKMPIPLTKEERTSLRKWIEGGSTWPGGDDGWIKPPKSGSGEV